MKLDSYVTPHIKVNGKGTNNLHKRVKTITILEENIWVNIHDLGFDKGFSNMIQKSRSNKRKIDILYFIKIKTFCASKGIIKVNRKSVKWEKIFANYTFL